MLISNAIAVFSGAVGCFVTLFAMGVLKEHTHDVVQAEQTVAVEISGDSKLAETELKLLQLQSTLIESNAERSQLAETLVQLTRDLTDVRAQLTTLEQADSERLALALSEQNQPNTISRADTETSAPRGNNRRNQWRTAQQRIESLLAAGIDEQTALDLQARRDQQQLARLELFDQAAREGWADSDQMEQRLSELNASRVNLRDELGEDAYERFLYESGDPNRVGIRSIISGSAADIAGLQVGDSITSYDNQRIFRVRELQQATREGLRGEYVQILFERDGQFLSTDIQRGPLGVTLQTSLVAP